MFSFSRISSVVLRSNIHNIVLLSKQDQRTIPELRTNNTIKYDNNSKINIIKHVHPRHFLVSLHP